MHQLGHVLEHVVDRLDDASLAEHYPVVKRHEALFHIRAQAGHDMHPVVPQMSEKRLRDVSLVSIQLAGHLVSQRVHDGFVAVVDIGAGQDEVHELTLFVAQEMQFEADVPSHRAPALGRDAFEHLHVELTFVVYHRDAGAVNKTDAGTLAETGNAEKHCQSHEATRHDFHETVVREPAWEQMLPLSAHA